jgi:N-formylglutamate amidohydrolase
MFDGKLPPFANVRSVRVAGGLGTIARIVSESEEIYAAPLDVAEGLARIEQVYKPYHAALEGLVAATHTAFGQVLLIDCHSMPSTVRGGQSRLRPDIVLGDRYGASCSGEISDAASHILSRLGYSISRNKPYAGGFITEHYGKPGLGIHAMQIEVNRCLYMDERTLRQTAGFSRLKADLAVFIAELAALFGDGVLVPADAAE